MDYLANKYTDYYEYVGYKWTKDRIDFKIDRFQDIK